MSLRHLILLAVVLVLVISTGGCASVPSPTAPAPIAPTPLPAPTAETELVPEPTAGFVDELEDLDPGNFDDPTNIDNRWLPLQPGTQLVLDGITVEAGDRVAHRITFTVTDLTKVINGIRTVVAYIVDFRDDQPIEKEIAFYAQDNDGNVWYLGEYPEVYERNKLVEAPAWIAGLKGAKAGIKMKAEPQLRMPSYSQGWGPAVNWTDRAQVILMSQETCVSAGCYEDVLVTEEFSQSEPGAFQLKYYAPGVGNVRVGWRGADATREMLELVEYAHLGPETLAEIDAEVLEQERRAYVMSKEVYYQTLPIQIPAAAIANRDTPEVDFGDLEDLDPNNFDDPTRIDNPWLPLQPGNQWILWGKTVEEGEEIPRRIVFTVTDLTKMIAGVPTVVAWIEDFADEELVEAELAFYAQDNDSNVWYLGEYPEEYEGGELVDAPVWIAGVEGARAGIAMKAEPQVGTPSYSQGWAPAVGWTDRAQVYQMGQKICVPFDCYENVLVMDEFNQEEPGAFQLKYYARGVGQIGTGWRGEDPTHETLGLVSFWQLDPEALAEARAEALALEEHAYEVSEDVYGTTEPAEGP